MLNKISLVAWKKGYQKKKKKAFYSCCGITKSRGTLKVLSEEKNDSALKTWLEAAGLYD